MIEFKSAKLNAEGIVDVSPEETFERKSEVKLIDVRRSDEWTGELGHIQGATLSTLGPELAQYLDTLPKSDTYVFVCRSGGRSSTAAAIARGKGLAQSYNMQGGMILWNRLGLPVEK